MNRRHTGRGKLLLGLAAFAFVGVSHAQCFPFGGFDGTPFAGCTEPWDNSNFFRDYFDDEDQAGARNRGLEILVTVFKDEVTTDPRRAGEITSTLLYSIDGATPSVMDLEFEESGPKGSNIHRAVIPTADLVGAKYVDVTATFEHEGDMWELSGDGEGRPAPLRYHFREPTRRPVTVTFEMRARPKASIESPTCVVGGTTHRNWEDHALTNWGKGIQMTKLGSDLYRASVRFPKGSYPIVWYKYKRDICHEWEEDIPDRVFVLPERKWRVRLDTARWNTPEDNDRDGWWGWWGSWPRW